MRVRRRVDTFQIHRNIVLAHGAAPEKGGVPMEAKKPPIHVPDGYELKFVAFITVKGKRLYARACGKRAWPILVKAK